MCDQVISTIVDELYTMLDKYVFIDSEKEFCRKQTSLLNKFRDYYKFEPGDFNVVLEYLRRLKKVKPQHYLTDRNYSYVLLVLVILYNKMYDDALHLNAHYAKWTCTNIHILNQTERDIFRNIRLSITFTFP